MDVAEAKKWLTSQDFVRFKHKTTEVLFDAKLYGEDAVLVRQVLATPVEFYITSLDVFCKQFEEFNGPQP
jgi:hypothetical protein